jgi:hypothetical protein
MFPVRYKLGFYIPEDGILHSHRRENHQSYIGLFWLSIFRWHWHNLTVQSRERSSLSVYEDHRGL